MLIPKVEIDFLHQLQALGNDNVFLGGSLLMAMMGIRREVRDLDVILDKPTAEQQALVKQYGGKLLDFLLYRYDTPPLKNLRYRGIPLDGFENMVRFKAGRAVKKDYLDLFTVIKWLVETKPEGVKWEESITAIIDEVLSQNP